jgi:hypothetical protein
MDDTRALAALDVVVNHGVASAISRLGAAETKLPECRKACPALFAEPGEWFEHRRDDDDGTSDRREDAVDLFQYCGRSEGGTTATCSDALCDNCGKSETHETPPCWLVFRDHGDWGLEEGGLRDCVEAWPACDYYLFEADGTYDGSVFCLPPEKCCGFRSVEVEVGNCDQCRVPTTCTGTVTTPEGSHKMPLCENIYCRELVNEKFNSGG